jgi:hypothetical protein
LNFSFGIYNYATLDVGFVKEEEESRALRSAFLQSQVNFLLAFKKLFRR